MFDFAPEIGDKKVKYKPLLVVAGLILVGIGYYYIIQANKNETEVVFQTAESVKEVYVDISGAVNLPGVYKLTSESRVADVLSQAGGVSSEANFEWVSRNLNLSRRVSDSEKVYVPFQWDVVENIVTIAALEQEDQIDYDSQNLGQDDEYGEDVEAGSDSDSGSSGNLINVNTASLEGLMELEGIGETYAKKIIDNRPYKTSDDLVSKAKLSENLVKKINAFITF